MSENWVYESCKYYYDILVEDSSHEICPNGYCILCADMKGSCNGFEPANILERG